MLLRFSDPAKLNTKRIIFEDAFHARDCITLEQLKELSSRRRLIEDSINGRSFITEAIAREMAGGLTSKVQQDLQKLEIYLPLLGNLVVHVESLQNKGKVLCWITELKIRWSSAMNSSFFFNFGGPRFYKINSLRFELGMHLYVYGATLREMAFEVLPKDFVESSTIYRRAAGVFNYLGQEVVPPLKHLVAGEGPPEMVSSMSSIMKLICLADAQAVAIRKAEAGNGSSGLLSKLNYGITQMLNEVDSILRSNTKDLNDISPRFVEFISSCNILHQLRSQKYFAEDLKSRHRTGAADGQLGVAIAILRFATTSIKNVKPPKEESWRSVFVEETTEITKMLRKFEYDNEFVYHETVPDEYNQLPVLEGVRMFEPIPYVPQKWDKPLEFVV